MPIYTYRREDGTEFDIRQSFHDDALKTDPETGQKVARVVHAAGIVFKGAGFYINDSKSNKTAISTPATNGGEAKADNNNGSSDKSSDKSETKTEAKTESKAEAKSETKAETSKPKSTTPTKD